MTASPAATLPAPAAVQVLSLADPLPGFPGMRDFALLPADAGGLVFWLQSVVPDGDVAEATANLRAPLVVNRATRRARQIVLTDGGLPIRQPLRR